MTGYQASTLIRTLLICRRSGDPLPADLRRSGR